MDDALIKDFNRGIGCHVASALEQTLLLPKDMIELRGFRRSEAFLHTKRFLGMVCTNSSFMFFYFFYLFITTRHIHLYFLFGMILIPFFHFKAIQNTFRLEELTNSCYQQLDDERKRRAAAVQTLVVAENNNADLKKKLTVEEQARKSVDSALESEERQVESQRKLAREASDQLAAAKEQLATLRKQLEETQRLRDQAEKAKAEAEEAKAKAEREKNEAKQHGYDVGVAEIEDALRAEVPAVCRAYCTQTWEEALNRVGIDASSELRKPENIFFLLALQVPN